MSGLDSIAVTVEGLPPVTAEAHNALPLLHEIRHALVRLADTGEPTVIDLNAIPFGPGDRERLFAVLGEGEVQASVDALGTTLIRETGFPGVWVIDHKSPGGDEIATHIEVTRLPAMLATPELDVGESAERLASALADPEQAS